MDDETGTLGKLKAAIAKAELVDMSSVKVGDIIYVSLNEEDGLILKDGYDSRRKYIVVIGFTPEGVAIGALLINSKIDSSKRTEELLNCQYLLLVCNYRNILDYDSWLDCSDIFELSKLKITEKNGNLIDREYIYYGLSPEHSQHGSYNLNIREKLFMFRIAVNQPVYVVDGENKNSVLKENVSYKSERPSTEQVVKDLWTNGYFELVIYVYAGTGGGEEKVLSVSGQDLFYISKLKVRHQHSTVFRHNKWWYSTRVEDLKGKWVDVSKRDMWLNKLWDLSYLPENFFIKVVGGSNGSKQQMSETYIANYVCKLTEDGAIDHIVYDNPTNLGFSKQIASMKKCTNSYMCASREDDLGGAIFNFTDPIIVSDKEVNSKGYEMHALNTGAVELVIAPVRIR